MKGDRLSSRSFMVEEGVVVGVEDGSGVGVAGAGVLSGVEVLGGGNGPIRGLGVGDGSGASVGVGVASGLVVPLVGDEPVAALVGVA